MFDVLNLVFVLNCIKLICFTFMVPFTQVAGAVDSSQISKTNKNVKKYVNHLKIIKHGHFKII